MDSSPQIIDVEVRQVYGNALVYPRTFAFELERLTGKKTLTPAHVRALKAMGFQFRGLPAHETVGLISNR